MARPAAKRSRIEQAAIALFAERGLSATTIKDIATRAGVTEGALYRHYSGKLDMGWKLYHREVDIFLSDFAPVLDGTKGTLEEKLLRAVEFIYRYYRDAPDRLVFVLLARRSFPREGLGKGFAGPDPDEVVQRFVKREIRAGRARKGNAVLLTAMLRGVVLEPILMHRDGRLRKHPIHLVSSVAAACAAILAKEKP